MKQSAYVAVVVGSLREEDLSREVAYALETIAPVSLRLAIVEIVQLPLYHHDLELEPPSEWLAFREKIKSSDAILFVTPEYDRSVPGVLKNAIDVGSHPHGQSAWNGKPAGVVSVSPGALGSFGTNPQLRQSLLFLNVLTMQQPEAYIIGSAASLFDAGGERTNPTTHGFLFQFMMAFSSWVDMHHKDTALGSKYPQHEAPRRYCAT